MFRNKALEKRLEQRIAELEQAIESQTRLIQSLVSERLSTRILDPNCSKHVYRMIRADIPCRASLAETGGLFQGTGPGYIWNTFGYVNEDIATLYAYRCMHCGDLQAATCFDVASCAGAKWSSFACKEVLSEFHICQNAHTFIATNENVLDSMIANDLPHVSA